ncbi:MAG: FAD:protein FMN transferase [Sedimentisphaerales bacterium]|jgi:thiamine biosynthesis lipoprotein|nr:FAD:protein FMN transferase [Sedimentisphaerales bacterium]HNY77041.1 FAD:protein FMN transferase [Sedimentisphaerales bacterium]HOC62544.1 FAD:protein FMN transferase [Sedimentisphaerales bacterium]HOH63062.1 FAD:protein FMN transferase [Sedimentisphaerales bacterium]HPY51097.1 FAD:protein FMN transferase [Sedimentisphaerales bacterium]
MTGKPNNPPANPAGTFVQSDWASVPDVHRFGHQAMATTFEIIVQHEDKVYARQAADAAFDELDRIERELSRYIENSDVARINSLPAGQPLLLGIDTFECLKLCAAVSADTEGAFDVTVGLLLDCWRDADKKPRTPSQEELAFAREHTGMSLLRLDESRYTVELASSPVRVDLGGVGKGYGVDRMGASLRDWSIERALIHGGFSSVLALEAPRGAAGWPVTLSDPNREREPRTLARLNLTNTAVSGSGVRKGDHIINPRIARPIEGRIAAWSVTPDAATGDALSTAFMVMTVDEVRDYCARHTGVGGLLIIPTEETAERVIAIGPWRREELVY